MRSHVRVVLGKNLELKIAVNAAVRFTLLLVDSRVLGEVSCCVVRARAFTAEEIASVEMMGEVILKVVEALKELKNGLRRIEL
jgi:hypothetical protein